MLFAEVVDTAGGCLWHSDKIDSMLEVVLDWFNRLVVVKIVKDKMVGTSGEGSIAWCVSLVWVQVAAKLL
jgi:hypothetical protein